ncbi:MAG: cob(I)yrinic acid a,c-diamide adenosyltransferase [Phycisphaerae bacterium]|nr:cob(I)yrinic acid a,c-diamide adenosyltransferase [Phycisphaerae bacterium]
MSIYTKTGDEGETQRIDGRRVRKSDPFLEVVGSLEELNAHLGLCTVEATRLAKDDKTASAGFDEIVALLDEVQRRLFGLGAMLGGVDAATGKAAITPQVLEHMEAWIDKTAAALPELRRFILPDGGELSARLHAARTVARRAERDTVRFGDAGGNPPPLALQYINRLGDWLFLLARLANAKLGLKDREL